MNLPPSKEAVRQFWVAIRAGASMEEAVAGLSNPGKTGPRYSRKAGWLWFSQAGGVVPAYVTAQSSGRFLSLAEREEIHAGVERGDSIRRIARRLGRAPSTVFHELRRNMKQRYRRRNRQGRPVTAHWSYRPSYAQRRAEFMARRPKPAKLACNLELRQLVQAKLSERLSPKQIAVELRQEFADVPEMWVSHEAIYQSIYVQSRGALRRELAVHLRTGRALRKPRRRATIDATPAACGSLNRAATDDADHCVLRIVFISRETLGWKRPAEALGHLLSQASELAGVATTE